MVLQKSDDPGFNSSFFLIAKFKVGLIGPLDSYERLPVVNCFNPGVISQLKGTSTKTTKLTQTTEHHVHNPNCSNTVVLLFKFPGAVILNNCDVSTKAH